MPAGDFAYLGSSTAQKDVVQKLWEHVNNGKPVSVDVETHSLEDQTPIGLSIATSPKDAFWFKVGTLYDSAIALILSNNRVRKIFHNGSFDKPILQDFYQTQINNTTDTMYMAQLLGLPARLNDLALVLLNRQSLEIKDLLGTGKDKKTSMLQVPLEKVIEKCCLDTQISLGCYNEMLPDVSPRAMDLELRLEPVIYAMSQRGIRIDLDRLQYHKVRTEKQVRYYKTLCDGMGFNPGSSLQVAWILKSRGHNVRFNKDTGNPVMTEEVLRTKYSHDPVSHLVLHYRHARSRLSTQIQGVEKRLDGDRIFITFRQSGADSGRISTSPNSQNIEYDMRDMYIASDGNELEIGDFSQIELRILAWLSQDPVMLAAFATGESIHKDTAARMYGPHYSKSQYTVSKNINFSVWYGGDDYTLFTRYGIPRDQGKDFIARVFSIYQRAAQWLEVQKQQIMEQGYAETYYGRKRLFPDINLGVDWLTAKNLREAINHIIQGTAGEFNKEAIVFTRFAPQVNTVHDELVFDVDKDNKILFPSANALAPFHAPIEWGRGNNWKEAKP